MLTRSLFLSASQSSFLAVVYVILFVWKFLFSVKIFISLAMCSLSFETIFLVYLLKGFLAASVAVFPSIFHSIRARSNILNNKHQIYLMIGNGD